MNRRSGRFDLTEMKNIPWKAGDSGDNCVQWILNASDTYRYGVLLEKTARYVVSKTGNCRKLSIFETDDLPFEFTPAFLYNSAVDDYLKKLVDSEILKLRMNGKVRDE